MKSLLSFRAVRGALVLMFNLASCAIAQNWTMTTAPTNEYWRAIASSADGSKLVAVSSNGIYASTNGGADWKQTSAPAADWSAVVSSADGTKLVAVADGSPIYTSPDTGATWKATASPANSWQAVAGSGDGSRLVVAYGIEFQSGGISTSTNAGTTWTDNTPTNGYGWYSVASSADGIKLAAMLVDALTPAGPYGWIYTSTNAGGTWTRTAGVHWPTSLASSADGSTLVTAMGEKQFLFGGPILTSTNFGATWASSTIVNAWASVASSSDGTRIVAATGGRSTSLITGPIYFSGNSGTTWMATDSPTNDWAAIASSADGRELVAAVNGGGIYTWQATPTPVVGIMLLDGNLLFAWTVPSMNFALQQTSDLTKPDWTNVATTPSLNSMTLQYQVTLPTPPGAMYYRLRSQ